MTSKGDIIVCICDYIKDDKVTLNVTIGKQYIIQAINRSNYVILNDFGYINHYPKSLFKPLSEVRIDKIDGVLGDNI